MDYFIDYDYKKSYQCSPVTSSRHCTKLMYLIIKGVDLDVVQNYLSENLPVEQTALVREINATNENGWTALIIACRNANNNHNFQIAKFLLEKGADVNTRHNKGWTALMNAARTAGSDSNVETVQLLLENGADVNVRQINGWTALMMAARHTGSDSNVETIRLLIDKGANVNLRMSNDDGTTALMLAVVNDQSESNLETVRILLENGANPNEIDSDGKTPLTFLISRRLNMKNFLEIMKLLLQHGANPNAIDQELNSIWNHPRRDEIITLLLSHNFNPQKVMIDGKSFPEYVRSTKRECDKYDRFLKYPTKHDLSLLLKDLPIKSHDLLFRPSSLRFQVMDCHWNLNCYEMIKEKYPTLMTHLSIDCEEIFRIKIEDMFKYIV